MRKKVSTARRGLLSEGCCAHRASEALITTTTGLSKDSFEKNIVTELNINIQYPSKYLEVVGGLGLVWPLDHRPWPSEISRPDKFPIECQMHFHSTKLHPGVNNTAAKFLVRCTRAEMWW